MSEPERTESEISGLNLKLSPVEDFIFSGLQAKILQVFQAPSVWATSTDKIHAVKKLFSSSKVVYPYACLILDEYTEAPDRGNGRSSSLRGLPAVLSDDMRRMYRVKYLPTDFRVTLEFTTNDFKEVTSFANRWMFARKEGRLSFNVFYGQANFGVSCVLDGTVTIPKRDGDPTAVSEYLVSSGLVIRGFISNPTLIEGQIKDTLIVTGALDEKDPDTGDNRSLWTIQSSLAQDQTGEINTKEYPPTHR